MYRTLHISPLCKLAFSFPEYVDLHFIIDDVNMRNNYVHDHMQVIYCRIGQEKKQQKNQDKNRIGY